MFEYCTIGAASAADSDKMKAALTELEGILKRSCARGWSPQGGISVAVSNGVYYASLLLVRPISSKMEYSEEPLITGYE